MNGFQISEVALQSLFFFPPQKKNEHYTNRWQYTHKEKFDVQAGLKYFSSLSRKHGKYKFHQKSFLSLLCKNFREEGE